MSDLNNKSTTEMSEELFNWLKRDGDSEKDRIWHKRDKNNVCSCGVHPDAKYKDIYCRRDMDNPDFFSPPEGKEWEYFGWMWERARIQPWCWDKLDTPLVDCVGFAEALYEWFENEE